jgi:DNA-binding NtrC family response regulator
LKHLLIIEDQEALYTSLSRRFTRRGFQVTVSSSFDEVKALLNSKSVDLCLSDISLNGSFTGIDILRDANESGHTVPFVFLTGHEVESEIAQKVIELGAKAVFSKPTDFSVLLEEVCRLLSLPLEPRLAGTA